MSEKKTIQINPDLFKMSNKKTKKKQPKIELKSEFKTQKQKTLRTNVLKMIREKQQDAYKKLFNTTKSPTINSNSNSNSKTEYDKDFNESLKFFSSLANKVKNETPLNTTFKNHQHISSPILSFIPDTPIKIMTQQSQQLQQ